MGSPAFNNAFGGDWLNESNPGSIIDSLARYSPTPAYTPAPNPFRTPTLPSALTGGAAGTAGVGGLPSALTAVLGGAAGAGAGGQSDIAAAIDRYNSGLGKMNTKDWIGAGIGGVQTIGGLIGAFGSLNLANKQYDLSKRMMETNLTNQVGAYNTALDDKARSRQVVEGQTDAERDEYIKAHSATTGR